MVLHGKGERTKERVVKLRIQSLSYLIVRIITNFNPNIYIYITHVCLLQEICLAKYLIGYVGRRRRGR